MLIKFISKGAKAGILCMFITVLFIKTPLIALADTSQASLDTTGSTTDNSSSLPGETNGQSPSSDTSTMTPSLTAEGSTATQTIDNSLSQQGDMSVDSPPIGGGDTTSNPYSSDSSSQAGIINQLNSTASSGNAAVTGASTGGQATTGNATAVAGLVNIITSSTNLGGSVSPTFFTYDIYGNVQGDINIDPSALASVLPASGSPIANINVADSSEMQITNNISLDAISGNASISNSGSGGQAATGNAHTVANVVNIVNSLANSGQSFLGVINIYGNLEGNILMPAGFLDNLQASAQSGRQAATDITSSNDISIINKINLTAASGTATVSNQSGGNVTSGNASTSVTILNLTGQKVVANNDLLVFVNVLGKWYGLIMNAPAGTTAAELSGGVNQNASSSGQTVNLANKVSIINNLTLNSLSGNASVINNGRGGNATTGNAFASVNLANLMNSDLSLSNWFGMLFINVFGVWTGNFGVAVFVVPSSTTEPPDPVSQPNLFSFVSHKVKFANAVIFGTTGTVTSEQKPLVASAVLAKGVFNKGPHIVAAPSSNTTLFLLIMTSIVVVLAAVISLGSRAK